MQKNKAKYCIGSAALIAALQFPMSAVSAYQSMSQWLLIDERMSGESNNLSSQLLFADKNSLSGSAEYPSLSISNLNFGEVKTDRHLQMVIIDSRMKVTINCDAQSYTIRSLKQYDQDNNIIENPDVQFQIGQWQRAQTPAFQALVAFSCNPDDDKYQQPFASDVQPLQGLIGYLNADWSK